MKKQLELLPQLVRELAQCLPETEGLASALHTQDFLEAERKHVETLEDSLKDLSRILSDWGGMGPATPPEALLKRANKHLDVVWHVIHNRRAERKKYDPT